MIVYFTGTGNSRFAAKELAKHLDDVLFDAGAAIKAGKKAVLSSEKPWVFAAPTYSWRMPRLFSDFIGETEFSGSKEAWFVLTCGSDTGNAAEYAEKLCSEKGLVCKGLLTLVMPENYVAMFPVPDEAESRKIVAAAKPVLLEAAQRIQKGESFPTLKASAADKLKSGKINEGFYRFYVKADAFRATDACTGCGACVQNCVLNNISLENGRPVWGKNCTHCMACICYCPAEAIEYGEKSKGKPRYRCPEV